MPRPAPLPRKDSPMDMIEAMALAERVEQADGLDATRIAAIRKGVLGLAG